MYLTPSHGGGSNLRFAWATLHLESIMEYVKATKRLYVSWLMDCLYHHRHQEEHTEDVYCYDDTIILYTIDLTCERERREGNEEEQSSYLYLL